MNEEQKQVNRLLGYSHSTLNIMYVCRMGAYQRAAAGAKREQKDMNALRCARILKEFGLKMGQRIKVGSNEYELTEWTGKGEPVGTKIGDDGQPDKGKYIFYRHRLERL